MGLRPHQSRRPSDVRGQSERDGTDRDVHVVDRVGGWHGVRAMSANRALAALALALSVTLASEAQKESAIAGIWLPDASRSQRFPAQPPYTDEGRRVVTE